MPCNLSVPPQSCKWHWQNIHLVQIFPTHQINWGDATLALFQFKWLAKRAGTIGQVQNVSAVKGSSVTHCISSAKFSCQFCNQYVHSLSSSEVGASDEDQIHEIYVIDTNMVYRLEGSTLEPYGDYWATLLKFEMLKTDEVSIQLHTDFTRNYWDMSKNHF